MLGRFFVTMDTRMTKQKLPSKQSVSRPERIRQFLMEFVAHEKPSGAKRSVMIGVGVVFMIILVIGTAIALHRNGGDMPDPDPIDIGDVTSTLRHPLTGNPIDAPLERVPDVFGVMIENAADAWPLFGLGDAFLVIEAPVEGNIPRFIAFFGSDQESEKIGPVRSARPYYLDWNAEFDGRYVHVGGSPEALEKIRATKTHDLDQFFQSEYFYRDERTRYAPHNVFTTMDDLRASLEEFSGSMSDDELFTPWAFQDGVSENASPHTIHIDWPSASLYNVDWTYVPEENVYTRMQGGNTYRTNTVVIIVTDIAEIDAVGRKEIRTIGNGKALIYQNGNVSDALGTWKKDSRTGRLEFIDASGAPMVMNAGRTWIEVVDDEERVTILDR